ncbi:MAG: glycosyltransferase family 2 protein [Phycisphaerae bacterium]|nr:glycosyltransferase family 2 protein [Phycisphaerae bacterium]
MRALIAIPVFNEARTLRRVLDAVLIHAGNVLVIDDGSTDGSTRILSDYPIDVIRHAVNRGYGRSIRDAFMWARRERYDWVVTMDCDEQHEPSAIPDFLAAAEGDDADVISGSRYLTADAPGDAPPAERVRINRLMTEEINARFGLSLTDAFCGYKAFRVAGLRRLRLTASGYAFPMQFWAQAVAAGLRIRELPVRRIYMDFSRSFGGSLDDPGRRLAHYRRVLHREILRHCHSLPASACDGLCGQPCE